MRLDMRPCAASCDTPSVGIGHPELRSQGADWNAAGIRGAKTAHVGFGCGCPTVSLAKQFGRRKKPVGYRVFAVFLPRNPLKVAYVVVGLVTIAMVNGALARWLRNKSQGDQSVDGTRVVDCIPAKSDERITIAPDSWSQNMAGTSTPRRSNTAHAPTGGDLIDARKVWDGEPLFMYLHCNTTPQLMGVN